MLLQQRCHFQPKVRIVSSGYATVIAVLSLFCAAPAIAESSDSWMPWSVDKGHAKVVAAEPHRALRRPVQRPPELVETRQTRTMSRLLPPDSAPRERPDRSDARADTGSLGPRPAQWCGWYMRSLRGGGPEFNVAANWRSYGSPARAQVGAVVVWDHHVGLITGQTASGEWIVKSGNWSNRVHEGPRSISGASIRI
jgi:hypothetical protein